MAILIDYSQIAIASIFADPQLERALNKDGDDGKNLLKHIIFNSIRSYRKKYGAEYGQLIICADGRNSWRKQAFPLYKAARKKAKQESTVNWEAVFEVLNGTLDALKENFPYPVIHHEFAEADDAIASITRHITSGEVQMGGTLFGETEKVMIISSDGDFKQLQKYEGVKQFSPLQKKLVVSPKPEAELLEKILRGDAGDGVPNILSPDAVFMTEGTRQKPFSAKRLDEFLKVKNPIDACKTDEERRNFQRNELLISFDKIPEVVYNTIVEDYTTQLTKKPNRMKMMNYFIAQRMNLMLEVLNEF